MSLSLIYNPLLADGLQYVTVETNYPEVNTYADLPVASTVTGMIYYVDTSTGSVFTFNKKDAGLYRSNGATWISADIPSYFSTSSFRVQDSTTPSKQLAFDLSLISSSTTRTLTMPNNSGTIALLSDLTGGTVTSISIATANGFSGSIATATTTPVITLVLQNATTSQSGQLTSTDWNTFNNKQVALVSATNIKTINGSSILGSGDLTVSSQWISVSSDIYFTGNVMIGQASAPLAKLHTVDTITTSPRGIMADQYSTTGSSQFNMRASGGNFASPSTILTTRVLSNINTWAHDGANFLNAAAIRVTAVGTIGTGRTPTKMEFLTMTDVATGVLTTGLTIDQNQNLTIIGSIFGFKEGTTISVTSLGNDTYYIIAKATVARTINSLKGLVLSGGSATIAININATPIVWTGSVTTISVTTVSQDISAISANNVIIGDIVTMVVTGAAVATYFRTTMETTR